jgi:hypothetical protein
MPVRQNLKCQLFLLAMQDDSIDGIYDTLKQTAKISQSAGGWTFYSQRESNRIVTFVGLTELQTELFRCCVCSMIRLVT